MTLIDKPNRRHIANLRREYHADEFSEESVCTNPIDQFELWFDEALIADEMHANELALATTDLRNNPSVRIVLLKAFGDEGFSFYTNYESRKGLELKMNPKAAMLFRWQPLERQVRIEGTIQKLSRKDSVSYFQSRPLESQISGSASPQSHIVEGRKELEEMYDKVAKKYPGEDQLPVPDSWGGYVLKANYIEFWQGRPSRLHDRICYSFDNDKWKIFRIAP